MQFPNLATVFDAGSTEFAEWTPLLWGPIGAKSVAETEPLPGSVVLDACCGAGSSALPAAAAVGPDGRVDAVDLSGELLALGRARAAEVGLDNVRFVQADVQDWQPGATRYDLVQSVFGVFFLPEMDTACDRLIGLLRPGGRFAVTTWEQGGVEQMLRPFFGAVVEERPELAEQEEPEFNRNSTRLNTESKLAEWLAERDLRDVRVRRHDFSRPIDPDSAWRWMLSGAARFALTGMDEAAVSRVRQSYAERLRTAELNTLNAPFLTGTGSTSPG